MKGIKIQNDVLTQKMVKADGFKLASIILGIIGTCFVIYNYMSPDTTVKTAGQRATSASSIMNRASSLVKFGSGEEEQRKQFIEKLQDINKEIEILNKEGRRYLNRLYGNNEEFREEIINFVRDKTELDLEVILDRRYKTITLNATWKKYLTECVSSTDNTKDVFEILAKYVGYN